jgi:predicted signal transduction protein with EAL and GGDEF domain
VAHRLWARLRASDTLARLGGDEFTVVLPRLQSPDDATTVAKGLLQALAQPFTIDDHELTIGASIGISIFPQHATDGAALMRQADSAMYAAKRNGKNQVCHFTPELESHVRERLSLENELRGAMERGEIHLQYQPEFEVSTGRMVRLEALARWSHPVLGNVPPDKFIPIAEESGIIVPLGAFIMEQACAEAAVWQSQAPYPIQVAVNVSSIQFARETFVEEVAEVLQRSRLRPELLQLELTESVMLSSLHRSSDAMKRLKKMGVSFAMDDFGTGYSCLSYLPSLPFDALKIDRSFVRELAVRPQTEALVHALVSLAHNIGMRVIVEGVELKEQLELVKRFGGNEIQGYLLGRPTSDPMSAIAAWANCRQAAVSPDLANLAPPVLATSSPAPAF